MRRLSLLTLVFAVLSVVFILLLIFFRSSFALYPLISYQDVFDLLTPLVLIPVYWLLFKAAGGQSPSRSEELAFMALAALWVLGHGMHLSANSIDNLIEGLAGRQVVDIRSTDIYQLAYWFDEHLSHYLWHLGVLGLAALLIYREARSPAGVSTVWWATIVAGILYGVLWFCIFLEGQTVVLGLPGALAVVVFGLISGRRTWAQRPVLAFFSVSCLLALILFTGWGVYWHGFPQFSDVGLI
jgi:hypothetical protein